MSGTVTVTIHARTYQTVIGQRRNGRAITGHSVALGPLSAEAATLAAARAARAAQVEAWTARDDDPIVLNYGGRVAVLVPTPGTEDGWAETRFRQDGSHGSASWSAGTRREAEARARYHLVQSAIEDWSDDDALRAGAAYLLPDDTHEREIWGPRELYRYAAWQRAAQHAIEAGRPDFHAWACEHSREFIPADAPVSGN